jgi:RNA polymerase sigma-70 factor, ECF subfamily
MMPDAQNPSFHSNDDALDLQAREFLECRVLIQSHIMALVRDAALAEDVFQDVWLRFEKATRHGEVIANVPAWCRATARFVALEAWRKQRREQPTQDAELAMLVDQAYEEQDGQEEIWRGHTKALGECMDALPDRSRELLERRYRHGESVSVIATQLRQTVGSVKTALCRLRLALAECVRKKLTHMEPT